MSQVLIYPLVPHKVEKLQAILDTTDLLLILFGYVSSFCFAIQYLPQIIHNFTEKSVDGFSIGSVIIKLLGSSFFFANALLQNEIQNVLLYSFVNMAQHSIFIVQFFFYSRKKSNILWLFLPPFALLLGYCFPATIMFTKFMKPISQILCQLPQIILTIGNGTTKGLSMSSQHLNFFGGLLGLLSCSYLKLFYDKKNIFFMTFVIYGLAMFQSVSIYVLYLIYDYDFNTKRRTSHNDEPTVVEDHELIVATSSEAPEKSSRLSNDIIVVDSDLLEQYNVEINLTPAPGLDDQSHNTTEKQNVEINVVAESKGDNQNQNVDLEQKN